MRFNPRTRVGCDPLQGETGFVKIDVSIHAPVWGATPTFDTHKVEGSFQSTHPCGVRRLQSRAKNKAPFVSIHAPVWGATEIVDIAIIGDRVSIHAPVWGATLYLKPRDAAPVFQSTHPCGVRPLAQLHGGAC